VGATIIVMPDPEPPVDLGTAAGLVTEDSAALAFTRSYSRILRFDHTAGCWFRWTGIIWLRDETKLAFNWCRRVARELGQRSNNPRVINDAGKAKFAAGVERFAQADRGFAVTTDIWDQNPWLLGTPGGTVDLCTGKLRPALPEDYITQSTAVAPAETADCPRWLQFMEEVTGGDAELARFLQQWIGYMLTGDTREEALLFIFGGGGNGKGKFLSTIQSILGGYCRTAAMETFTASKNDRHPTDLAMLKDARMVCVSETEEGHAWAEGRIKAVTGNDVIAARFMRRDFFEYRPQFKLTIIGNHKPVLRNVDEAARRRFNMVPFNFKPNPKDPELEAKLRREWPGILRWMIEGCIDWQQNGLLRSEVVVNETAEYFAEQDTIAHWLAEQCEKEPIAQTSSSMLFQNWSNWARSKNEDPGTNKTFSAALERHYPKKRTERGVVFLGLRLLHSGSGTFG
jgi:putative DNA primase/helicase